MLSYTIGWTNQRAEKNTFIKINYYLYNKPKNKSEKFRAI